MSDDLAQSLAALGGLLTRPHALIETLELIAGYAMAAVPGADGVGLALLESGRARTLVATADFVHEVDELQYSLDEGPCVSAVADRRTYLSGNLGGAAEWPRFGPRAGRLGVHSALSLPLLVDDRVLGALNIYAHARDAYNDHAARVAEALAPQAAVNAANAGTLAQAERLVDQLQAALVSRAEIDQAIGILMSRGGGTAAQAFERLRASSQSRSVKVSQVAREILDQAVNRAHARQVRPGPE